LKVVYEEFQDQTQQKLLELEGEINWYRQQNNLLYSKLEAFQDNEEELWGCIDYLQEQLEQKEQKYIEWQKFQTERLNTLCQTELKLEELLTRYKKGKLSWEKQANLLNTELEQTTEELTEQKELLVSKNISITNLSEKLTRLKKELWKQNQANHKKKKQLQRTRLQVNQNQQKIADKDNVISQLQQDYKNVKHERDTYQTQLEGKDQKIAELEAEIRELKNKPPLPPINNQFQKAEVINNQESINNFTSEKESLLTTINQQNATIKELQQQLTLTTQPEIREVLKTDLTAIRELQTQLRNKEQTISQFHLVYLLTLGVGVLLLVNMVRMLRKKRRVKSK
jgi:myosin heavy subunit